MYIPDPIEQTEARQDRLADEWEKAQAGVPKGSFRCPYCSNIFSYELIQAGSGPDSPAMCYNCLPNHRKKELYDASS